MKASSHIPFYKGYVGTSALIFLLIALLAVFEYGFTTTSNNDIGVYFSLVALTVAALGLTMLFAYHLGRKRGNSLPQEGEHYRHLLEALPVAVYTTDASGVLTYYNEAAARLWKHKPEIGRDTWKDHWKLLGKDGLPLSMEESPVAITLRENRPVRGKEVVLERPDGSRMAFLPYPTPLRDEAGKLVAALNVLVDISDRKHTEISIERRNKWLRLLSETSAELADATDPAHMMHRVFARTYKHIDADIFFNYGVVGQGDDAYLQLKAAEGIDEATRESYARLEFGESVCGMTAQMRQVVTVNDLQNSTDPHMQGLRGLGVRAYICQPLIADNELIGTLSFGTTRKDRFEADEIEFIKTIGYYVTSAKKRLRVQRTLIESEARAQELAQRAEAANIAKTEFLANMSHEIRTPMNAIVGLTGILDAQELTPAKQKDIFKTLKLSVHQLMGLINDVLDLSKIESDHLELEHIPFDLDKVLTEIIGIHSLKAAEKGIGLKLLYGRKPEQQLLGDPLRLKQMLMNLVSNAVKFTETGEVIIQADCQPDKDGRVILHIDVRDTGIGIREENLKNIFGKFTQADASMTRKYGGTGLGLAISRKLCEAMGGEMKAASHYGQGSCFTVRLTLPVQEESKVIYPNFGPAQQDDYSDEALRGVRVLLVEDYAANIMVATALLEQFGCIYRVAQNGEEALRTLKQENFDIVLMDVQMPLMDGLETTRFIRAWEKDQGKLPVAIIGITAHVLTGDRERCLEAGMDDYISKPFQPDDLKMKLAKYTPASAYGRERARRR